MDREVEASGHSLFPNALIDQGSGFSQKTKKTLRARKLSPPTEDADENPEPCMGTR
jgi:hypothetical protein